jgi:lysophospholipase L1-like esterase
MKKTELIIILLVIQVFFFNGQRILLSQPSFQTPDNQYIQYTGRIDFSNPQKPRLSGAGAYLQVKFRASACSILLEDQNLDNNHNYISIAIDGKYQERIKLIKNKTEYEVAKTLEDTVHTLIVCKATEAQIGYVDFLGLLCTEILPPEKSWERKIEFIGDSITCGMGLDASEIPCNSAQWYDQHNAYLAYGRLVADKLNANWLFSSVSGIGITRNWNSPGPTMPEVYEHTYLNTNSPIWNAKIYIPDLVSICLGTNDFSDGDGTYKRAELDSAKFINDYIQFRKRIRARYPHAQICCLTSPMFSGEKSERLTDYLSAAIKHIKEVEKDDKVYIFKFSRSYSNGCTDHPDRQEHEKIAEELLPFFKGVMNW